MAKKTPQTDSRFLSLPRLRAGHGIPVPQTHEWTAYEAALREISRNIDVQNSGERAHSIPDIFSQSIQFEFELAIGNPAAVGQWQGLMATLLLSGAGGLCRVRDLRLDAMGDSPFLHMIRSVAARRGIASVTLFELKRKDGTYGAVAFRTEGMPAMLCPAADTRGPFAVDDPWIVRTDAGCVFTAPAALLDEPGYADRRVALRNEIYALATRNIPPRENRDGLQLTHLKAFYQWLGGAGDAVSSHPIQTDVRARLFTLDPSVARRESSIFIDRLCLFREGGAYNRLTACADGSMRILSGNTPSEWCALLPVTRAFARESADKLRSGALRVRMQWHNGAVDADLFDERDALIESKRYRLQDLVNFARHRNAPQVAVWPPRVMAGWNRYYLLRYDDGNALPLSLYAPDAEEPVEDVALLSKMPAWLSFTLDGAEAGVLLPRFDAVHPPKAREMNVGFDFGTTGTTAYRHDPQTGVTTPISFAGQGALFLFGREEGADVALTAQLVAERITNRSTHYTLLRRKTDEAREGGALTMTTIPFVTNAAFNPTVIRDVHDNLKWGAQTAEKLSSNLFLEQYLMMCLWNVVENGASYIHWRASYPLSMDVRLQDDFVSKIQTIVGGLCQHCFKIQHDTYFCSESEAVGFMMMDNAIQARYLKGLTIHDNTGFFCMDIGGGSTDLSMWLRRKPLMQASLKFAGNAILCDSVTRENHGDNCPPRDNLIDCFFLPGADEGKRQALALPLAEGRHDEFRRVWNVLIDEIADAIKGIRRDSEPLSNYLNIVRMNLYLMFFFAGRMAREAILSGAKVGTQGVPLPVAVLGNGAKMMKLLYNDVEPLPGAGDSGTGDGATRERRNEARYADEMEKLNRAFGAGCAIEGFEAVILEPFMPKQEIARGLALAPEAFLLQRASRKDAEAIREGWPMKSAYDRNELGAVRQSMTDEFRTLVMDSFSALRRVFGGDDELRKFLASLFPRQEGEHKYSVEAYYQSVWTQCLRQNPEPMLPDQPLPPSDTVAGRYVEVLAAMNRMMRTAE